MTGAQLLCQAEFDLFPDTDGVVPEGETLLNQAQTVLRFGQIKADLMFITDCLTCLRIIKTGGNGERLDLCFVRFHRIIFPDRILLEEFNDLYRSGDDALFRIIRKRNANLLIDVFRLIFNVQEWDCSLMQRSSSMNIAFSGALQPQTNLSVCLKNAGFRTVPPGFDFPQCRLIVQICAQNKARMIICCAFLWRIIDREHTVVRWRELEEETMVSCDIDLSKPQPGAFADQCGKTAFIIQQIFRSFEGAEFRLLVIPFFIHFECGAVLIVLDGWYRLCKRSWEA